MRIDFQTYFMMMAKLAALRSTCNSRPTGAVIVKDKRIIATGYNGSLSGKSQCCDNGDTYCYRRAVKGLEIDKYNTCPAIHAEENAIAQAARQGISVEGASVYCTLSPCLVCAKSLKASGINKVYYELSYESSEPERDKEWMKFNQIELSAEQIIIDDKVYQLIRDSLFGITSKRRLEK